MGDIIGGSIFSDAQINLYINNSIFKSNSLFTRAVGVTVGGPAIYLNNVEAKILINNSLIEMNHATLKSNAIDILAKELVIDFTKFINNTVIDNKG